MRQGKSPEAFTKVRREPKLSDDEHDCDALRPGKNKIESLGKGIEQSPSQLFFSGNDSSDSQSCRRLVFEKDMPNQILIVDTDNFHRDAVQTTVNSFGFQSDLCSSGAEGL